MVLFLNGDVRKKADVTNLYASYMQTDHKDLLNMDHRLNNSIKMATVSIVGTIYAYFLSVSAMEILVSSRIPTKWSGWTPTFLEDSIWGAQT